MARLHVARDTAATVISRGRLRSVRGRPVRRPWSALAEYDAPPVPEASSGLAVALVPPTVTALAVTAAVSPEAGIVAGALVFFGVSSYLAPVMRRRRAGQRLHAGASAAVTLTEPAQRVTFDQAIRLADRISETWPRLGTLIDPAETEALLAAALWEIAGVLARRQELTRVLADLSRPDFATRSPADETARELQAHLQATKAALADLEVDLARRLASLARAERAGRDFIREQEMRRAIRDAAESLRTTRPLHPGPTGTPVQDPGADLAEHTRSVVDAYRELTADLRTNPPAR